MILEFACYRDFLDGAAAGALHDNIFRLHTGSRNALTGFNVIVRQLIYRRINGSSTTIADIILNANYCAGRLSDYYYLRFDMPKRFDSLVGYIFLLLAQAASHNYLSAFGTVRGYLSGLLPVVFAGIRRAIKLQLAAGFLHRKGVFFIRHLIIRIHLYQISVRTELSHAFDFHPTRCRGLLQNKFVSRQAVDFLRELYLYSLICAR